MPNTFGSRLKHAWNAFLNRDPPRVYGGGYSYRPDRPRLNRTTDRTILTAIYARMAQDATAITINHVRLDENDRFDAVLDSGLNSCLNLSANKDQTGRALRYDIYLSLLDEGVITIVPVDIDEDPVTGETEIRSMRVGKVKEWYPDNVRVELYNDRTGQKEEVILPKERVAIVENPFYSVMNEPNSTVQRLISKLRIMDAVDEQAGSGKLDLIIQLPYAVKSPARKEQAQERRKTLEEQLAGSRYGIGYIDATEHITQLNQSLENNLLKSIEYLTNMAYSQLGLTPEIMNGTADDTVMTNYENRVIPILLRHRSPRPDGETFAILFDRAGKLCGSGGGRAGECSRDAKWRAPAFCHPGADEGHRAGADDFWGGDDFLRADPARPRLGQNGVCHRAEPVLLRCGSAGLPFDHDSAGDHRSRELRGGFSGRAG